MMSRRLYISNMISVDGYFEGPGRDISWHLVDSEYNDYAIDMLESVDRLLFGRITWELMASWLIVAPILLGRGTSLFDGLAEKHKLTLMGLQSFSSGHVLLRYNPSPA